MTEDKTFERTARTWLEEGPATAPQRSIAAALKTIETTPQQRTFRVPRRSPSMLTPLRLAAVAAIVAVVLGGGFLLFGRTPPLIGTPSPVPTSSPTVAPSLSAGADPGRRWLVFERKAKPSEGPSSGPPRARLWAVRADGTELHELASTLPNSGSPDFSPDATVAVVVLDSTGTSLGELGDGSRLWSASVAIGCSLCNGVIQVPCDSQTAADCEEFNPAFSPDGKRLAFIQHQLITDEYIIGIQDRTSGDFAFLESTRDAGHVPNGTPYQTVLGRPTWSDDGRIAYQRTFMQGDVPQKTEIYVVNADDTNHRQLPTPTDSMFADPDWSPDGSLILLSNDPDRDNPSLMSMGIYTIDPDSGLLTALCTGHGCGANPSWTSDGSQILAWALNASNGGTWALMAAGGGEMVPINPDLDIYTSEESGGLVVRLQPASAR